MKRQTGLETWATMKAKHPDALLLYRVGQFYEAYRDDAKAAAEILGITLIRRHSNGESYYMAGFPHHALDSYLPKLVRAGKRIAICDTPDPEPEKKVKRGYSEQMKPKADKFGQLLLF